MRKSVKGKAADLLLELRAIDDRELRFDLLIEYAERFEDVPNTVAKRPFDAKNKVPACESDAYAWVSTTDGGTIQLHFAVENPQGISAKALAVILKDLLDGCDPKEVADIDEQIIQDIFGKTISMGKGQGLMGMIRLVKQMSREIQI